MTYIVKYAFEYGYRLIGYYILKIKLRFKHLFWDIHHTAQFKIISKILKCVIVC